MDKITQSHKLYFLIAMVLIAGLIAYLRFFRESRPGGKPEPANHAAYGQSDTQPTPGRSNPSREFKPSSQSEIRRHISRNIFEPAGPLPAAPSSNPPAAHTMPKDMILNGTIVGGDLSMAIINNQFMQTGQKLGDYTVVSIAPDEVCLASRTDRRCLSVITVFQTTTQ